MTAFIQSSPGLGARLSALDGWSAGEGPLLHSHLFGQTIKHLHTALTQAGLPQNIPSLAQGLGLSDGKEYGRGAGAVPGEARQAQAPEKVSNLGSHPGLPPRALALPQASHLSPGLSSLICEMGRNAHTGGMR